MVDIIDAFVEIHDLLTKILESKDQRPEKGGLEHKFAFAHPYTGMIQAYLDGRFARDPEFNQAIISSLYFDRLRGELLAEKVNSDYLKSKFRLRTYLNMDGSPLGGESVNCFAEAKRKEGTIRHKERVRIAIGREDWEHPHTSARVQEIADEVFFPLAGAQMRPVIRVQYRRCRWVHAPLGIRISLDSQIEARDGNPQIFPLNATQRLRSSVLEVKADDWNSMERFLGMLEPVRRHLQRTAFSKYLRCCRVMMTPILKPA